MTQPSEKEQFAPDVESYRGIVPLWLIIVYASLAVWGVYYLIVYWSGPASGG